MSRRRLAVVELVVWVIFGVIALSCLVSIYGCAGSRRSVCGDMSKQDCDALQRDMNRARSYGAGKAAQ